MWSSTLPPLQEYLNLAKSKSGAPHSLFFGWYLLICENTVTQICLAMVLRWRATRAGSAIRRFPKYLSLDLAHSLIHALIASRVDY